MNVLVLTSTYSRWENDTEPKFVDNLCHHLAQSNTVHVVAPHTQDVPTNEIIDGIQVYRFRYCFKSLQTLAYDGGILPSIKENPLRLLLVPLFMAGQWLMVVRLLRRNQYDVIHAHWIIPQGLVAALALPFTSAKPALVLTSHGGDLFALKGKVLEAINRWISARAQILTVVSSVMKQTAEALKFKSADRIEAIPMGVDASGVFSPPQPPGHRSGLLFVGRLVDKKGLEYLLQAMPTVILAHPDEILTIVGSGPLETELRALCTQLAIEDHVVFTGALENNKIPALLQQASVTIFPSIVTDSGDQEGTPVAIMEALACGCAAVVADYPGARDVIVDAKTGLLVPQRSPTALAQAILKLLEDPLLRETLGKQGREAVQAGYDWSVIAQQYLTAFTRAREIAATPLQT